MSNKLLKPEEERALLSIFGTEEDRERFERQQKQQKQFEELVEREIPVRDDPWLKPKE